MAADEGEPSERRGEKRSWKSVEVAEAEGLVSRPPVAATKSRLRKSSMLVDVVGSFMMVAAGGSGYGDSTCGFERERRRLMEERERGELVRQRTSCEYGVCISCPTFPHNLHKIQVPLSSPTRRTVTS